MVQIIIGNKGSGKTKRLIDLVNSASEASRGDVVCVEQGDVLTYSITHKVRLVDTKTYGISGYAEYYGLLCGICAGNHDVTDVFGDATLRIGSRNYNELADFLDRVSVLSEESNINFCFTVSCDEADLPAKVFEVAEKL